LKVIKQEIGAAAVEGGEETGGEREKRRDETRRVERGPS